jgi:predicted nucleotidyltransferase
MKIKSNKIVLFEYFLVHPQKQLRLRELERETNLPLPSLARYLKELHKEGIVRKEQIGSATFYRASRATEEYRLAKKIHTLQKLHTSKLIEVLKEHYHNAPLRLYGSAARGEDDETSDLDLFIETPLTTEPNLQEIERKLGRTIHLLRSPSIRTLENKDLANNILNGIPLQGRIEVFA